MKRIRMSALAALGLVMLLSGCGGGSPDNTLSSGNYAEPQAPAKAAPEAEGAGAADRADAGARNPALQSKPEADGGQEIKLAKSAQSVIYTAEMTVRVAEVSGAAEKAKTIVKAAGGHVFGERSSAHQESEATSTIIFKVPPPKYEEVLAALSKDLGKLEARQQDAEDVTVQVADVESRIKSTTAAIDRFKLLLGKAEKIGDLLNIQQNIDAQQIELESLQARQKALSAQVSLTTITVNIVGPTARAPVVEDEPDGFLAGLGDGWNALVTTGKVLFTVLGVLLPWLALIIVPWVVIRLAMRRPIIPRRRRPRPGGGLEATQAG
ncbi:DUF4349 domain-containing protein [Rhizohabitans arisaemae]|uniref:DUF4349 domain-containing protein n=1 Tax=Rhizohabitans arisaemae TaxID=2720610 RepID=UPI0024B2660D|nr:DUF4349 domain-containing protein [Rhizohabitans arisaemae]